MVPPSGSSPPPVSGVGTYTLDGCEKAGDDFAQRGEHAAAIEEFKRALLLLGSDRGPRRVGLYLKIGEATAALGKTRVAINNYLKVLAAEPRHDAGYDRLLELYRTEKSFSEIDELQRKRVEVVDSTADKIELWRANAALWLDEAKDPARGIAALEQWLELDSADVDALELLAGSCQSSGRHERAIEALSRLGELGSDSDAARRFERAAALAEVQLKDLERALALVERGLGADPDHAELLASAERLATAISAWDRLADLHERLSSSCSTREKKFAACMRHASLARDKLADLPRAERGLLAGLALDDENALLLRVLSQVQTQLGANDRALASCRAALAIEPRQVECYQQAYELFGRLGVADGAFQAALVLDQLGEADINQSLLADTHRPEGLLTPQGVLSDVDWEGKLLYSEREADVQNVIALLAPAAIEAKLELLRRAKRLPTLEADKLQDLQSSTATLVRALVWTTRILGIAEPALYLNGDVAGDIQAAPNATPALLASRSLGSGLALNELAFLWGRALAASRPEQFLAVFYPSPAELEGLLRAALAAASGKPAAEDAKPLAVLLDKAFTPEQKKELKKALAKIEDIAEAADDWLVSVELSAVRAGLLAAGDLGKAVELTTRFPFGSATEADDQLDELYEFSVSAEYQKLRARLGVALS